MHRHPLLTPLFPLLTPLFPLLTPLFLLLFITLPLRADGLRVGTAVVDISPTVKPFQLRSGKSTYVHDPLHVRAVAFENGQGRAVIAVMDAIGVGREMCDEAKAAAAKVTGWKPEYMLIAGTHTHTAVTARPLVHEHRPELSSPSTKG